MKSLMKKTEMKVRIFTIFFLLVTSGLKAQSLTDFSGTWVRNTEKCDAGDLSVNSIPVNISVEQNKSQIQIKRLSKNKQGDSTAYTEKIKFDGSSSNILVKVNLNKSATVASSADGKQLIETSNYNDNQGNTVQKAKENWSLSDAGKTLTIKTIILADGKDYQLTEVFAKQ